jgi:hypothetical protein
MKHWRDYHPNFQRVTLQAHSGEYRAEFTTREQANAFVRAAQKFAAAIRRDDTAPTELKAAADSETGGVLWHLPVQLDGSWAVRGLPRASKRLSVNAIAENLP